MKKLMSLVLVILMMLSCTSFVFAKDVTIEDGKDAAYVVSDATVVAGENVTVSISVVIADDYTAGVGTAEIDVEFPTDKLTYVSATSPLGSSASINSTNAANGKLRVACMADTGLVFDENNLSTVLEIVFSPVEGETGTAEVKIADTTVMYDATLDMNDVAFQIVNGTVTFPAAKYTATFKDGDNTISEADYAKGETITKPADPAKDGYVFKGWKLEGAADTAIVTDFTMGEEAVTYVAVFNELYTVTYATAEGTAPTADTVEQGESVTLPAAPVTKAGYTFAWVIGGTSYDAGASYTPTADVAATATWTANTDTAYRVEIYLTDDEGEYPATASETKNLTGTTDATATASHANYTYEGYEADNEAANVTSGTIAGDGSLTLKLYYKKVAAQPENTDATINTKANYDSTTDVYTAEVYLAGQSASSVAFGYTYGEKLEFVSFTPAEGLLPASSIPEGLTQVDTTNRKLIHVVGMTGEGFIDATEEAVLLGTYKFNYIGDEEFDSTAAAHNIAKYTVSETIEGITDGESFLYTEAVTSTVVNKYKVCFSDIVVTEAASEPEVKYTVTFKNGEETVSSEQYSSGDAVTVPEDPTKTGYTFKGWAIENTTAVIGIPETVTADATYVAIFVDSTLVLSDVYVNWDGVNKRQYYKSWYGITNEMLAVTSDKITITLPYGWPENVVPAAGPWGTVNENSVTEFQNPACVIPAAASGITATYTPPATLSEPGKITISNETNSRDVAVEFVVSTTDPGTLYSDSILNLYPVSGRGFINYSKNYVTDNEETGEYNYVYHEEFGDETAYADNTFTFHEIDGVAKIVPVTTALNNKLMFKKISGGTLTEYYSDSSKNVRIEGSGIFDNFNAESYKQVRMLMYYDAGDDGIDVSFTTNFGYSSYSANKGNTYGKSGSLASDATYKTGRWEYVYFNTPSDAYGVVTQLTFQPFGKAAGSSYTNDKFYIAEIAAFTSKATAFEQYKPVDLDVSVPGTIKNVASDVQYRLKGEDTWIDVASATNYTAGTKTLSGLAGGTYELRYAARAALAGDIGYAASPAAEVTVTADVAQVTDGNISTEVTYTKSDKSYVAKVYYYGPDASTVAFGYTYGENLAYKSFAYGEDLLASDIIPDGYTLVDEESRVLRNVAAPTLDAGAIAGTESAKVLLGTYTFEYTGTAEFDKDVAANNILYTAPTETVQGISNGANFLYAPSVYDPEVEYSRVVFDAVNVTVEEGTVTPVTYTATFKVGGEVYGDVNSYEEGQTITPPTAPTPEAGYTFKGWAKEGTTEIAASFVMGNANVVYVAIFEEIVVTPTTYTATFKVGGEVYGDVDSYEEGQTITPPTAPTPEAGYTFKGWAKEGTTEIATSFVMGNANVVYVAIFEEIAVTPTTYTATFMVDGNAYGEVKSYEEGGTIEAPADPVKTGNIFKGWAKEGTTEIAASFVMGNANVVYVAIFEEVDTTLVLKDLYINHKDVNGKLDDPSATNAQKYSYTRYGVTVDMLKAESDTITITLPYGWNTEIIPQAGEYHYKTNPAVVTPVTAEGITAVYTAPASFDGEGKITITNTAKNTSRDITVKLVVADKSTVADIHKTNGAGFYGVTSKGVVNTYHKATYASAENYPEHHGMKANLAKFVPVYGASYSTDVEGYGEPKNHIDAESYSYYRMLVYYDTTDGVVDNADALKPKIAFGSSNNRGSTPAYTVELASDTYKTGRWEYIYFGIKDNNGGLFGYVNQPRFKLLGGLQGIDFTNDVLYIAEISLIVDEEAFKQYMPVEYVVSEGKIANIASDVEFTTDDGATWTLVTEASNYNKADKTLIFNDGATVKLRYAANDRYAASDETDAITVAAPAKKSYVAKFGCDYIEHDDVTAEEGEEITLPTPSGEDIPTGCTFLGWRVPGEQTLRGAGTTFELNGDVTLEAEWLQTEFLITYETDFGTAPAEAWTSDNGKLTLAGEIRKNDSTFKWVVKGTTTEYAAGSEQTFTENTTLVATWTFDTSLKLSDLYINAGDYNKNNKYTRYTDDVLDSTSSKITITLPYGWNSEIVPAAGPYNKAENPAVIIPVSDTENGVNAEYKAPDSLDKKGTITISNTANGTTRDVEVEFIIATEAPAPKTYSNYEGMYAYANSPGIVNMHYGSYQSIFEALNNDEDTTNDVEITASQYHGMTDVSKFVPVYTNGNLDGIVTNATNEYSFKSSGSTAIQGNDVFGVYDAASISQYRFLVYYEANVDEEAEDYGMDTTVTPKITLAGGGNAGGAVASLISENYKTGRWEYLYFATAEDVFGWVKQPKIELLGDHRGSAFKNDVLYIAEYAALATPDEKFLQYKPVDLDSSTAGRISNVDADVEFRLQGTTEYTAVSDYTLYDADTKTLYGLAGGTYELRYAEKAATETVGAYAASEAAVVEVTAPTVYTIMYESEYGTAPDAQTVTIGDSINVASAIQSEGNVFDGWKIKGTDTVIEAAASYTFESDTILVAVWKKSVTGSVKVARISAAAKNFAQIEIYNAQDVLVDTIAIEDAQTVTNEEGVFEFTVKLVEGDYTAKITKTGYLVADIAQFTVGENGGEIELVELVAGNVAKPENLVDLADFAEIVRVFDGDEATPEELAKYDIDEDGDITVDDLDWIKANFGAVIQD